MFRWCLSYSLVKPCISQERQNVIHVDILKDIRECYHSLYGCDVSLIRNASHNETLISEELKTIQIFTFSRKINIETKPYST